MDRWEYHYTYLRTKTNETDRINHFLNQMGVEGWELVNVIVGTGGSQDVNVHGYYFKRRTK